MKENGFTPRIIPELQEKINDSDVQATLAHLLDKLEMIESSVTKLNNALELTPNLMSIAADVADSTQRDLHDRGIEIEERIKSVVKLADKLSEPATVERIESLIALTDRLPGMTAMAADILDEKARANRAGGIHLEERLEIALKLADRLTEPETLDKLNDLLDIVDKAPGIVAMASDIFDAQIHSANENGVHLEQRINSVARLTNQLTEPKTIESIEKLLRLTDQAPGMMAMFVDVIDHAYRRARIKGYDLESLSSQGVVVARKMSDLFASDEFDALISSGVLDPKALEVLSVVSGALIQCRLNPPEKMGVFRALRSLGEPEIQKALGFLISFARNFGGLCNQVIERERQQKLQEQQN